MQLRFVHMLGFGHEAPGRDVFGMQEHLGDRAGFHQLAGVQHRDAVADTADHIHLMGDQHDGQAQLAVDLRQQLQHRGGGLRVQRAGGLVAQQDLRPGGQRTRDAHPLLLPARELRRILVGVLLQSDPGQQFGHARIDLGTRCAGQFQREGDIAGHGARGQQVEVLENHADAATQGAQALAVQRGNVLLADQQAAAAGLFQPVDQPDQGGFPRAGMADDAEYFAGADPQIERMQRHDLATVDGIGLVQALKLDHRAWPIGGS
ncbi:hypothetical protein XAUB_04150 [Xanthomonas citri pv. aurantifolii str. ICPB 11122]|nr:hypothetical protein XAUB_04150 [Xanthomonas citri pv. aurantifolii str. ICPB 11122]